MNSAIEHVAVPQSHAEALEAAATQLAAVAMAAATTAAAAALAATMNAFGGAIRYIYIYIYNNSLLSRRVVCIYIYIHTQVK